MQLTFETLADCGDGVSPSAVHDKNGRLRIFYIDSGIVKCREAIPPGGQYSALTFTEKGRISPDETVSLPSIKRVPHYGAYGFWSAEGDHRFVIYMMPTDISNAFNDGSVKIGIDSAVSSFSCDLTNLRGQLLNRNRALVTPGVKLEVYYSLGDSGEVPLGIYYIDRSSVGYPSEKLSVSARDAVGKILKEQSFDENHSFNEGSLHDNIEAILEQAEVEDFFVGDPGTDLPLEFEPDTTILEGIDYAIANLAGWKVEQTIGGRVGVAHYTDSRFDQPGVYSMVRDRQCWEYSIEYDDSDAAARVCVYAKPVEQSGETVRVYKAVGYNRWWEQPPHRTLYVQTVTGSTSGQCSAIADTIAASLEDSGRLETFAGIFQPQLTIGDEVRVTDENGLIEVVGSVTDITHSFGKGGFFTSFTVDSGGRKGRKRLKDLIDAAASDVGSFTGIQQGTADGDEVSY